VSSTENIGLTLSATSLILYTGRDFSWSFQLQDTSGNAINFPAAINGQSYGTPSDIAPWLTLNPTGGVSFWGFAIAGSNATCQVPNATASEITNGTAYQLVFMPSGTVYPGGYSIRVGTVEVES
jgi:hypothetical protein